MRLTTCKKEEIKDDDDTCTANESESDGSVSVSWDYGIGSDLIYVKECVPDLVKSFNHLSLSGHTCKPQAEEGEQEEAKAKAKSVVDACKQEKYAILFVAVIRRFHQEEKYIHTYFFIKYTRE